MEQMEPVQEIEGALLVLRALLAEKGYPNPRVHFYYRIGENLDFLNGAQLCAYADDRQYVIGRGETLSGALADTVKKVAILPDHSSRGIAPWFDTDTPKEAHP
jgi:hypothetical protein